MADLLALSIGEKVTAASGVQYRVVQRLGAGGNADAYLVVATSGSAKGVPFALKVFRRLAKPERRASFLDEIRFVEDCEHPGNMRFFDRGIYNET